MHSNYSEGTKFAVCYGCDGVAPAAQSCASRSYNTVEITRFASFVHCSRQSLGVTLARSGSARLSTERNTFGIVGRDTRCESRSGIFQQVPLTARCEEVDAESRATSQAITNCRCIFPIHRTISNCRSPSQCCACTIM